MSDVGRRPLRAVEVPHLQRLGRYLSGLRRAAGLTQPELALAAGLSRVQVARIETGVRRTRRSTLHRVAAVLVVDCPGSAPVDSLVEDMVSMAGPALAEESAYAERVTRRRTPREEKTYQRERRRRELALYALLYDMEHGKLARWRPEGEMDELRAGVWGHHTRPSGTQPNGAGSSTALVDRAAEPLICVSGLRGTAHRTRVAYLIELTT